MELEVMPDCPICYQGCISCLHELFETCPNCELALQNEDWRQVRDGTLMPAAYGGFDNIVLDQSTQAAEQSTSLLPSNEQAIQTSNFSGRRREWTDAENREFERWITSNPKPTRLDKYEFASAHLNLTFQQVQNKINNWRNGRNIQRQRSVPGGGSSIVPQRSTTGPSIVDNARAEAVSKIGNNDSPEDGDISMFMANVEVEFTETDFNAPISSKNSPAPSVLRYLKSTELEADRDAIEHAVRRVSLEAVSGDKSEPPPKQYNSGFSLDAMFGLRDKCNRCEKQDLECDRALPCRRCQDANDPVIQCSYSYSLQPTATKECSEYTVEFKGHKANTKEMGFFGRSNGIFGRKRVSSPVPANKLPPISFSTVHKASSVAVSVAGSAKSSRSGRSSVSARYQQKLQRRSSANNRRFSLVELNFTPKTTKPPSNNPSRRSLPSMAAKSQNPSDRNVSSADDDRSGYFRCPIMTCTKIFRNRKELETHEESNHFSCYCTFCKKSFNDHETWRTHESTHFPRGKNRELLWQCGICDSFGVSERKRYIHIRDHWKKGYDILAWVGDPVIIPLSTEDLDSLDWLTNTQFDAAANRLLEKRWRPPSAGEIAQEAAAEPRVRLKDRAACSEASDEIEPPTIIHGLFASLRRKLPSFRKQTK